MFRALRSWIPTKNYREFTAQFGNGAVSVQPRDENCVPTQTRSTKIDY